MKFCKFISYPKTLIKIENKIIEGIMISISTKMNNSIIFNIKSKFKPNYLFH